MNFFTVICIIGFLALIFTDLGFKLSGGPSYASGGGRRRSSSFNVWKVGFFHYIFAGIGTPKIIAFFGSLGIVSILRFLLRSIGLISASPYSWFNVYVWDTGSPGQYVFSLLMYYIGIWTGVVISLRIIKKFYPIDRGRPVIVWSAVFALVFTLLAFIYLSTKPPAHPYESTFFNYIDHIIRITLFFVLTKWYMYRIVIVQSPESEKAY